MNSDVPNTAINQNSSRTYNDFQVFTIHQEESTMGKTSLVGKLAWMLDGVRYNPWKENFIWPLLALRALFRFPYSTRPNGEIEVKIFSLSFLYWIVGYSIMFGVTINNCLLLVSRLASKDIDTIEGVIILYKVTIMVFVLSQPLSLVRELHVLAALINECPDYLIAFEKGLGTPVRLYDRRWLNIICCVAFLYVTAVVALSTDIMVWMDSYSRFVILVQGSSVAFVIIYWVYSTLELSKIGDAFADKIHSELCKQEGKVAATKVKEMRLAWLELTRMIKANADAFSFILSQMLSWALTSIFIMSCFVSINMLVSGNAKYLGMIAVMVTAAGASVIMHECGHRLSRDAGLHVGRSLAKVNLLKMDQPAIEEVKLFLKNVSMNYPSVKIAGVISINRFSITSMISVSVTYLIVLVQWQVDDTAEARLNNEMYQSANNSIM